MWSAGFLPGCLCSLTAISIERKSRRGALAVYMLNQVYMTSTKFLKTTNFKSCHACTTNLMNNFICRHLTRYLLC